MRVMICQPLNGADGAALERRRELIASRLEEEGHDVWIDVTGWESVPDGARRRLWLLGRTLQHMAEVDAVYFADGWEKDKFCRVVYESAALYGIRTINAYLGQLKPFKEILLSCADEINLGTLTCDFCNHTPVIFGRENIMVDGLGNIGCGEMYILCQEHAYKFECKHQRYLTPRQLAELIDMPDDVYESGITKRRKKYIKKLINNFKRGLYAL